MSIFYASHHHVSYIHIYLGLKSSCDVLHRFIQHIIFTRGAVLVVPCVRAHFFVGAHSKSGDDPPSNQTLCSYKRLVTGLKAPAFAALKEISESEEKGVDIQSLSKALLDCPAVLNFPAERDFEQSLLIHILARYFVQMFGVDCVVTALSSR